MPFKNQHPLYHVWMSMKERCRNPNFKQFMDYGGRGITVCDRWLEPNKQGFLNFVQDMGERPPGYVIDRKDNNQGYSPENCHWVTKKESQKNRRVTVIVEIEGIKYRACDLSDISGIKTDSIIARAKKGMTYNEVIAKEKHYNLSGLKIGWKYGRGSKGKSADNL